MQLLKKTNNNIIEDLVESEGNESAVADLRRMIRTFSELKEIIQKQLSESQENMDKKVEKSQKQLNELKEDFNKL
jgi:molybdenum-dependent DNA-binding transcriptional regulator ModE